jgi:4-amino-4-deoxy-L-arabinose transferase-like glycosyltransferase
LSDISTTLQLRRAPAVVSPAAWTALLIAATAAIRIGLADTLGLGVDESYAVAAGRVLRLGYFDHPPLMWWISAATAHLAGSEAALVVRLPFIVLFAVSTWLMFRIGETLFSARAGLWAAVALNLSPVFGVTTGSWVLPDGPLICALLGATLCLARALDAEGPSAWRWWLGAGAATGLALLSKYSAVLVLAGAGVYLLTQPTHRRWLARPHPYAALVVAAFLFTPVVAWNAAHGWASFAFQGGRAEGHGLHLLGPLKTLAGEALFVLPWIWLGLIAGFVRGLRAGPAEWRSWLLCCLGAGPVLLFALVSLWSRNVLFHWAAPGYLMLFPLFGVLLERMEHRARRAWTVATAAILVLGLAAVLAEVKWHWLRAFTVADPALEAVNWTPLRDALADRGMLRRPGIVIAATNWSDAGKLDYALGGIDVLCLNPDSREYGFIHDLGTHAGQDVLIVAPRQTPAEVIRLYANSFGTLTPLAPVRVTLPERPPHDVTLVLGHSLRRPAG